MFGWISTRMGIIISFSQLRSQKEMDETKYHRQLDILDPKLMNVPVVVIGAGATGSFTALSLGEDGSQEYHCLRLRYRRIT